MSEFGKVALGKAVTSLNVSPQFDAYSGVEVIVSEDTAFFAGNRSGRVLTIENPWGTQEQANSILSSLISAGFQYQPYTASGALLNPSAEIGDGVTINGVYSGLYKISRGFGPLMVSDIEAPQDEEVDHEYPFEPKQDRIYKREIGEAKAQIAINSDSITSLVSRADATESSVTTLEQTATTLSATAMRKSGGSSSSFGWDLTDSSWTLNSNGSEVFKATASGIEVKGKITATSGFIGNGSSGFTISASAIYNGMTNLNDAAHNGIYIGTDGIALGKGNFKVTSSGSVYANNMTLSGTLTVGGENISASVLRQGAQAAYSGAGGWNGAMNTVNANSSYWSGGAAAGYSAKTTAANAQTKAENAQATADSAMRYFSGLTTASNMLISRARIGELYLNGWRTLSRKVITVNGTTYTVVGCT